MPNLFKITNVNNLKFAEKSVSNIYNCMYYIKDFWVNNKMYKNTFSYYTSCIIQLHISLYMYIDVHGVCLLFRVKKYCLFDPWQHLRHTKLKLTQPVQSSLNSKRKKSIILIFCVLVKTENSPKPLLNA